MYQKLNGDNENKLKLSLLKVKVTVKQNFKKFTKG
jgi:hypothetical protein